MAPHYRRFLPRRLVAETDLVLRGGAPEYELRPVLATLGFGAPWCVERSGISGNQHMEAHGSRSYCWSDDDDEDGCIVRSFVRRGRRGRLHLSFVRSTRTTTDGGGLQTAFVRSSSLTTAPADRFCERVELQISNRKFVALDGRSPCTIQ